MAKRRRNNQKRQQNRSGQGRQNARSVPQNEASTQATVKAAPITAEDVASSASMQEFEANKDKLIQQLLDEIKSWENKREATKKSVEEANAALAELEEKKTTIEQEVATARDQLKAVQNDLSRAQSTIQDAQKQAEDIRSEADSYAEETKRVAEEERVKSLSDTAERAKEVWQDQIDDLEKQIISLAAREKEVAEAKRGLERERLILADDKGMLEELKADLLKRKERYDAASPVVVSALQTELEDERTKYNSLQERYSALSKRYADLQVYVDSIRVELEDPDSEGGAVSVGEILAELRELKEEHDELRAIKDAYPSYERIVVIEEKARRTEALENENASLRAERNRYREEVAAAENGRQELELTRRATIATRALNDHLLRELESHKAALESRAGDTCASLTQVDVESEQPAFIEDIARRRQRHEMNSLKALVEHVKNYAGSRDGSAKLFYTDNDIRAFLAGMAVSRLVILQGMSGTGKSSLPRIFAEAISGFNKLIPVESSWRDRNELLGYYNDFNKKFNAKAFTVELYRGGKERCRDIPTFIVLDEMNLARIEYYFSDFLAILEEPNHDKWLVELVPSDMRSIPMALPDEVQAAMKADEPTLYSIWERMERSRNGDAKAEVADKDRELLYSYLSRLDELMGAKDLVDGRKIRVTENIWFIGTANRDESTFEISDKVYDRAQVVSLNKKGVEEKSYKAVDAGFISASDLQRLFNAAIRENPYKAEIDGRLSKLDDVLMNRFDTSFGNRIVAQAIDFAAVYMCAGGNLEDALDYQISTKIIRKVIMSDDVEALLILQDALEGYKESSRLVEKRLRELGS